jgi:hypothetical protein
MSYMANRDHIAITTGDKSTTRSKVFVAACPDVRLMRVTLRDSSDTYSRIVAESEKLARAGAVPIQGTEHPASSLDHPLAHVSP